VSDLAECPKVPIILEPHPNANALSLVKVGGFTVVVNTEEWKDKPHGLFVAPDCVLADGTRVKPKKLRGVVSQGMLLPIDTDTSAITRYKPDEGKDKTFQEAAPPVGVFSPKYDVDSYNGMLRKANPLFLPNEPVFVTEKLDGENMRVVFADGKLHVGSRNNWRKEHDGDIFWQTVTSVMRDIAQMYPLHVFYGEKISGRFYCFDCFNPQAEWVDVLELRKRGMPSVPELFRGPFMLDIIQRLADYPGREGVVIQSLIEGELHGVGRKKFKLINSGGVR
jgi:tRNA-binding EMAP/Myf-like protein